MSKNIHIKPLLFLLTFFLLFLQPVLAQESKEPTEVKSEVTEVTVFLQGAQIGREGTVSLQKGKNELIFKGLETGINPNSIQAAASQQVILNSVVHQINYMNQQEKAPKILKLEDSLRILQDLTDLETQKSTVLYAEKNMILANQNLASQDSGLNIDELAKAADFFRSRLGDIQDRLQALGQRMRWINSRITAINQQMNEWNYKRNQPSNDILVTIEAPQASKEKIRLAYLIDNAGWIPGYDLRAKDSNSPIQLEYRADVYQNTGLDWKQVHLTLSSGNPNQGAQQPSLNPWNLSVYVPAYYNTISSGTRGYGDTRESAAAPAKKMEEKAMDQPGFGSGTTLADYTKVQETATTAEFEIGVLQDIPSDGKKQQVSIQSSELPAQYQHFAIPKLDKDAFLVARVIDWEKLNILAGNVNIYFEGTFVAESMIDPRYTEDTLEFSLGRDKKVVIQRDQMTNYNKVRLLGTNRERTFGFEFTIRNTKKETVQLRLEDQIPISQDKDITVKLEEGSGGKLEETTGKITWDLTLAPNETRKIKLIFSVKYPKDSNPL